MKSAEEILNEIITGNANDGNWTQSQLGITEVLQAMHEYASHDRWVKVSERLPEMGERVIIFHSEIGMQIGWIGKNNKWNGYYGQVDKDHVTDWQPLPTAPKD